MSPVGESLYGPMLRETLATIPGWVLRARGRQLLRVFQFPSKKDATTFMVMAVAVCFERGLPPDLTCFGRTVTVHLVDAESSGVTRDLVELARLISRLAGPTIDRLSQPRTGILAWLVEEARGLAPTSGETERTPAGEA